MVVSRGRSRYLPEAHDALPRRHDPLDCRRRQSMSTSGENLRFNRATPVLYVEEIEPCISFWTDRLGFEPTGKVPHGNRLGFVMMERNDVEVMYQSRASLEDDLPAMAEAETGGAFLFVEVNDLDAVERALGGIEPEVPRRQTFYGTDELVVREPGGNVVTFAEFLDA